LLYLKYITDNKYTANMMQAVQYIRMTYTYSGASILICSIMTVWPSSFELRLIGQTSSN